jgi:hypothetical protein
MFPHALDLAAFTNEVAAQHDAKRREMAQSITSHIGAIRYGATEARPNKNGQVASIKCPSADP